VVALPVLAAKGLGGKDVLITESPSSREPPADIKAALARETSTVDIALVSGSRGTIDRDAVCGLLNECLHDVSSAILVASYLVGCC
jgi:hypothetical protein